MIRVALLLALLSPLAACGPMPLEQAERSCLRDARLAQHPRGSIGFGVGSGGMSGAVGEVTISSDYLLGRDPDAVYAQCVQSRAGQPPTLPFHELPESRM